METKAMLLPVAAGVAVAGGGAEVVAVAGAVGDGWVSSLELSLPHARTNKTQSATATIAVLISARVEAKHTRVVLAGGLASTASTPNWSYSALTYHPAVYRRLAPNTATPPLAKNSTNAASTSVIGEAPPKPPPGPPPVLGAMGVGSSPPATVGSVAGSVGVAVAGASA